MKYYILLLLCFGFTVLKADTSLADVYFGLTYNGEGYLYPFPEQCTRLLDEFADYASNFTKCSIKHARPIRLCERCIDQYVEFDAKYQELLTTVVNGTSCRTIFISHDRLDAVLDYHDNILSVWNKGNCKTCFDWSSTTPQLLNSTNRFNKMFNDTLGCISDNLNQYGNNSEEVCQKCMQTYIQLDEYYKSLSVDAIGVDSICMDIVDSMNTTRSIWSKSLNCCQLRKTPELIFLCCTGIISLLPILFYLGVRFCGPIRDLPKVLRQSRFKQSILQSVDGRIN
ncbi:osteopetrosis-associated transmembrane protein 1 [Pectinophora gossypiella]|uniref:osteopetrosis-associated transmembrane protein 1 n=1 Tax=Pectinophora gossypiella TaxID=13191 RepID=UPI00214F0556|nr:osteopetrosis-associated transmembrane protein 1 [Pectinophora gossypiella]